MASAPNDTDELFDQFLTQRGHDTETVSWEEDHNKKRCPECGGLHDLDAAQCGVCGWAP
jgi:hypothetical protein